MLIGKNKLKKHNSFDVLDADLLENYLSEMALKGWMISDISIRNLTFERIDPKVVNFFVDITKKNLVGNNSVQALEYTKSCQEKNLELICGNEKFQIFINNSDNKNLDRQKLNFINVFKEYFYMIFTFFIIILNIYLISTKQNGLIIITDNRMLILLFLFILAIFINISIFILKLKKYNAIVKNKDLNFDIWDNFKKKSFYTKLLSNTGTLAIIMTIFFIVGINGSEKLVSNKDIPLSLEDFNEDISGNRQVYKSKSSSPFGKYYTYSDYAFVESKKIHYDNTSKGYYEEYIEKSKGYVAYSVIESKYDKVLEMALQSILSEYDRYGFSYKYDKNDTKDWGAKSVYTVIDTNEKVIVYDNVIITINIDDFDINNYIDLVKEKLII